MPRPQKKIDWKRVNELLEAGCPGTEIAAYFGMHPDTFYKRVESQYKMGFSDYSSQKKSCGDALIREAQYKKATKRLDNTMLVWLGKNRLGQKENTSEREYPEDVVKPFVELMSQITALQSSARKIDESNIIREQKSA